MFLFTLLDQGFFRQLPSIMLRQTLLILSVVALASDQVFSFRKINKHEGPVLSSPVLFYHIPSKLISCGNWYSFSNMNSGSFKFVALRAHHC